MDYDTLSFGGSTGDATEILNETEWTINARAKRCVPDYEETVDKKIIQKQPTVTRKAFMRYIKKMDEYQKLMLFDLPVETQKFLEEHNLHNYWHSACIESQKKFPMTPSEDILYFSFRLARFIELVEENHLLL